ncbi:MAG TPA: hypothetical protein VGD14_00580, partial [bacterium]
SVDLISMLSKAPHILGSSSPRLLHIVVEANKIALNQQSHQCSNSDVIASGAKQSLSFQN